MIGFFFQAEDDIRDYDVTGVQTCALPISARLGKKQSEETKQKIAKSRKGRTMSSEHKAKIAAARLGKKQSEETKQKIAKSRKSTKKKSDSQKPSEQRKLTKKELADKQKEQDELIRRYDILGGDDETT